MDKDIIIQNLLEENRLLRAQVLEQSKIIESLKLEIRQLKTRKNSNNSSIPPSVDLSRKNKSLRTPSGKKPGGQPGHEGSTLKMVENPDEVHKLMPEFCNHCGKILTEIIPHFENKRQVVEIPPISPIYKEYQVFSKKCSCGHIQKSDYPDGVTNNIQYGASVEALLAYLSVYQYVPFKRLQEFLAHSFNLHLSQGSIANKLAVLEKKASEFYQLIKEQIENSKQVGSDETGVKINGNKSWIWVWQNSLFTFISASEGRGKATIDKLFPNGFSKSIINSDRWLAQLNTEAKGHQLCTSHLLRNLNFLIESEKTIWAEEMKTLLMKAIDTKREYLELVKYNPIAIEIENEMNKLLATPLDKSKVPKTLNLQKALTKHREFIFPFLYHAEVPPDNNGSERAIRNVKVKQKISGQFKTGQSAFCVLRSIIDTCIKNKIDVLEALNLIAKNPMPQVATE